VADCGSSETECGRVGSAGVSRSVWQCAALGAAVQHCASVCGSQCAVVCGAACGSVCSSVCSFVFYDIRFYLY
jgi:hypothetical protein